MDVLVPDWSDWSALKVCEVRPSLVSSARVGQNTGFMRGAGFHQAPATAASVLAPFVRTDAQEKDEEMEAAPVD
ncbi:MAG TPA: hypothetical protein VHF06_28525 [Pseudonocardiaceae bacterium]|jgi:hypothetical protein|nr:hypothetical protein [Pseudonocardiaceae bacterium]